MPRKTRPSIPEGFKVAHSLQRDYHNAARCFLHGSRYLASEEELITAGLGSSLRKCLTVTGGGCRVDTPVNLKLFLGKSPAFLDEKPQNSCPPSGESSDQVFQELFRRTYAVSHMQMPHNQTASLETTNSNKLYDQRKGFHVSIWVNLEKSRGSISR